MSTSIVAFSTNASEFKYPEWYAHDNGTIFYFNPAYTLDWVCNKTFKADPDIAGPGVILSFCLIAWLTILVAAIPICCRVVTWLLSYKKNDDTLRMILKIVEGMLQALSDIQTVTGTSIVIAGLAQLPGLTFYHEQIIINSWWLTLNSLWAARQDYTGGTKMDWTSRIRVIAMLVSAVLSIVFQGIIIIREKRSWSFFLESGRCYLDHDRSSEGSLWLWLIGAAIYAVALLLSLMPPTAKFLKGFAESLDKIHGRLRGQCKSQATSLRLLFQRPRNSCLRTAQSAIFAFSAFAFCTIVFVLWWLLVQFLAVWSYGHGSPAFELAVYISLSAWSTSYIVDLKHSNLHLLEGSEVSWGFGQVLPIALMAVLLFAAADATKRVLEKERPVATLQEKRLSDQSYLW